MNYKNGKDILPAELLEELQKYIQGELIYIPKEGNERAGWGKMNGTRTLIDDRNREIYRLYKSGLPVWKLGEKYNLSEDSIRKIVFRANQKASEIEVGI